jgi:hypothetical protein
VPLQESSGDGFVTTRFDPGNDYHLQKHIWRSGNNYLKTAWEKIYDGIHAVNRVIHQFETTISAPEEHEISLIAELRAVRAYYYYLLMDNFGSVPLITKYESTRQVKQVPRWKVYNFVINELTEVIPKLSGKVGEDTYGRMTKWAAKALLARVYLNSEVYVDIANYQKVVILTDEIISPGHFRLDKDYLGSFRRENHNSPEIIWAIPYDEVNAPGNWLHMRSITWQQQPIYQMQQTPWGGSRASPQFIDTYDQDDSRLENTWLKGPQITSEGDTVINFVKDVPSLIGVVEFRYGYRQHKFEVYQGIGVSSDVDFPIFRFTEVLMMKAEALLRTGSPGEAAQIVTRVRERAFADTDPSKAVVTAAELQSGSSYNYGLWKDGQVVESEGGSDIKYGRFLDELGWEFAMEGHRRQDLIRFDVFTRKSWFAKESGRPCKIVFPIPENALEENPNLEQHPCYK